MGLQLEEVVVVVGDHHLLALFQGVEERFGQEEEVGHLWLEGVAVEPHLCLWREVVAVVHYLCWVAVVVVHYLGVYDHFLLVEVGQLNLLK